MNKPARPYKNLEEFRTANSQAMGFDTKQWPCLTCKGEGCESCNGTGKGTKEACQQAYKTIIDEWKQAVELWKMYKTALAKLTKEEVALFHALGLP